MFCQSVFSFFLSMHFVFNCLTFTAFQMPEMRGCCCLATPHIIWRALLVFIWILFFWKLHYGLHGENFQNSWFEFYCTHTVHFFPFFPAIQLSDSGLTISALLSPLCSYLDCRLCEPADGRCVNPAALTGNPGEHGSKQPQPLSSSGPRNHRGTAHRAPASVSTHTRTGASRTLIYMLYLYEKGWVQDVYMTNNE